MIENELPEDLNESICFHGHFCPGLAIGYRAAKIGLDRLGAERAVDEELIAIVENDTCAADAVQWLTGCTFGKGNFFFRDHGKQVFTFALRPSGRAVRVALRPADDRPEPKDDSRDAAAELLLSGDAELLFKIEDRTIDLPDTATIRDSITCDECGEPAMCTRIVETDGRRLCRPCAARH